ncbi:TPA: hypothetical protein R1708_000420 [Campylobacter lari]|nr:hypothetical protein [Campylobacter lari]
MKYFRFNQHKIVNASFVLPNCEFFKDKFDNITENKLERFYSFMGFDKHYVCGKDCYASDLGAIAASPILQTINKENIDMLIVISPSPDYLAPQTAHIIHDKLKLNSNTIIIDKTGFCTSLIQGLFLSFNFLDNENINNILLIYSQSLNKKIKDKLFYMNMSDNASAFLIQKDNNPNINLYTETNITSINTKETLPLSGFKNGINEIKVDNGIFFETVISYFPALFQDFLKNNNIDVDYFFLHCPNKFLYQHIIRELDISPLKLPQQVAYEQYANLGSNSIFFSIHANKDLFNSRKKILLGSYGSGFTLNLMTLDLNSFNSTLNYIR